MTSFCEKCENLEYQYDILQSKSTWKKWCIKEGITPCECEPEPKKMESQASQAILREAQREAVRNAELNWVDITKNKDFFFVSDLMAYSCGDTIKLERGFDRKMVSFVELYFTTLFDEEDEKDEINRKLKIAKQVLGASNPKYQKLIKAINDKNCEGDNEEDE